MLDIRKNHLHRRIFIITLISLGIIAVQTSCFDNKHQLGPAENSERWQWSQKDQDSINSEKWLSTKAVAGSSRSTVPLQSQRDIKQISQQDPINILYTRIMDYEWNIIEHTKLEKDSVYELSINFFVQNNSSYEIALEEINAVYQIDGKNLKASTRLSGLLKENAQSSHKILIGRKTKEEWVEWLLSIKGLYHLRILTENGEKAREIAKLIGDPKGVQAVEDKIHIGQEEQRVSSGVMGSMSIKSLIESLDPKLLDRPEIKILRTNTVKLDGKGMAQTQTAKQKNIFQRLWGRKKK